MPDNLIRDTYLRITSQIAPIGQAAGKPAEVRSPATIDIIQKLMNNYPDYSHPIHTHVMHCLKSHAPDKALLRFDRFAEAAGADFFFGLTDDASVRLSRIFSSSAALTERITGRPELASAFVQLDEPDKPRIEHAYYSERFSRITRTVPTVADAVKILHHEHIVQLMRICARNADPSVPIVEINHELSVLAESVVGKCLEFAYADLANRAGVPLPPHRLIVIGLGKLGGSELNVSSDIDLIYLTADSNGMYGSHDSQRFHTMLAERLTRIIGESTESGILYRVDTRLRADGSSGPLVRSTQDYLRYLEMRGEAWERQMLLKARPIAGDIESGRTLLRSLERFIFPMTLTRSPNREIVEIKNRIEARIVAEGSKKTHLKLVPGGVRDIEFITQCLQLLMGGMHPEVRDTGTLPSLARLMKSNALSETEYTALSQGYILYRKIENALQWRELLPAFSLPDNSAELDELAMYLGKGSGGGFALAEEIETSRYSVREVFDSVFSTGDHESFDDSVFYAAAHPSGDDRTRRFLESLGFGDPEQAGRTLARLVYGEDNAIPDATVHESVQRFIPKLLKEVAELSDPGGALERFSNVAASYRARHTLFDILETNAAFLELLLTLSQGSIFITDLISQDPSLLDLLVEAGEIRHPIAVRELDRELQRIDAAAHDDIHFTRACLTVKNREKLRIGVRDITGLTSTRDTFRELTLTAECMVRAVYSRAAAGLSSLRRLPRGYSFAVLAAGRLGSGMMDFGSDLDLIFVFTMPESAADSSHAQEESVKLARTIQALVTGGGGPYKMYDVDARLRPEGGNAVLAVSLDEYRRYLDQRASVWERLALIRTRSVAGNTKLGEETVREIGRFVYGKPFTPDEIEKIMDIRASMIEKSRTKHHDAVNVKSGAGGIADIDFIAQTYAAHFGCSHESLRQRETAAILSALGSAGLIKPEDAAALTELYSFLCDVEKTIRIGSGRSINTLPSSEPETARIARLLGFRNTRRFKKRVEDTRALTTQLYERLMNELRGQSKTGA